MKSYKEFKRFIELTGDILHLESYYKTWDSIWDSLCEGNLDIEDYGIPYTDKECDDMTEVIADELQLLHYELEILESSREDSDNGNT